MKILVLGDSDTSGRYSGGTSWPEMLRDSLDAEGRGPVELKSVGLSVVNESAVGYVSKRLGDAAPDVVVLVVGSFGFTSKFTWLQVQRLFGKRAGAWYRKREDQFDSKTRSDDGRPLRTNLAARRVIAKLIKKRAYSTRPAITATYKEIFRTLSRAEDAQVVIMSYPGTGDHARTGNAPRERALFFAELKVVAESYHYRWVDTAALFADEPMLATKVDDLHFNSDGHTRIAEAVRQAVLTGLPAKA